MSDLTGAIIDPHSLPRVRAMGDQLRTNTRSPALSTSSYEEIVYPGRTSPIVLDTEADIILYPSTLNSAATVRPSAFRSAPWADDRSELGWDPEESLLDDRSQRDDPIEDAIEDGDDGERSEAGSEAGGVFSSGTSMSGDFVVLSRPRSRARRIAEAQMLVQTTSRLARPEVGPSIQVQVEMLAPALAALRVRERQNTEVLDSFKQPKEEQANLGRVQSPTPPPSPGRGTRRRRRKSKHPKTAANSSSHTSVDTTSGPEHTSALSIYEAAAQYVTHFLNTPLKSHSKSERLAFLQALIIELGLLSPSSLNAYSGDSKGFVTFIVPSGLSLPTPPSSPPPQSATMIKPSPSPAGSPSSTSLKISNSPPRVLPSLPSTLTSARQALKTHAFICISDYLALRSQGPDALAAVLYPSRNALRRALMGKEGSKRRVKKESVKGSGLSVLLVGVWR